MIRVFRVSGGTAVARALLIGAAMLAGAGPVLAQRVQTMTFTSSGPGGGMDMYHPPVTQREMDRYAVVLGLNDDQKTSARSLVEAIGSEFSTLAKQTQEKMDDLTAEFNDSHDPSVFRDKMPGLLEPFQAKKKKMTDSFFSDLKLLLSPEQEGSWEAMQRLRRRERSVAGGSVAGEAVDLVRICEKLGVIKDPSLAGASESVRATLETYATQLDAAIKARDQASESRSGLNPMAGKPMDPEELSKAMAEAREKSRAVRDVNQSFARQLGSQLPEETAAKLALEVKKESFPQVYRDNFADRTLAAAIGLADLSDQQRGALQAIKEQYQREADAARDRWASAIQENDTKGEANGMVSGGGGMVFMRMGDEPDAVKDARKAKRDLDDRTLESVKHNLSETQQAKLPSRRTQTENSDDPDAQSVVRISR